MRRRLTTLLLSLPLLVLPGSARGAEEDTDAHVVVTSTRLDDKPAPAAELPATVTVIDREAIERSGARNVQDLLVEEAGVLVYDQVGNDVEKTLDLRGFSGGRGIAVFLDGARLNDTRNNTVSLEQIPLSAVERIEITRGASAAVTGGGSQAGVVRIVTRRGAEPQASLEVAAGTYDALRVDGSYGQDLGRFDVFGAVSHDRTDGFRINAGGEQTRADASVGFDLGASRRLALSVLWSELDYGNPGALTLDEFEADPGANVYNVLDDSRKRTSQVALNYHGSAGGGFSIAANLSYRDDSAETLSTGRAAPTFGGFFLDAEAGTWSGTAQATHTSRVGAGSNDLAFGVELLDGEHDSLGYFTSPSSPGSYDPANPGSVNTAGSRSGALFVQDAWSPSARWTLVAGARADRARVSYDERIPDATVEDDRTFSELSFRGGATFRPSEHLDLRASYADAYLPPTPEQLFAFPTFGSNPELEAQDARTYEIGARARGSRGTIDAAVFWTDTRNEILFDPPSPEHPGGLNINAGTTRRRGVELSARGRLARRVVAFTSFTYTDAEFTNGADEGNTIPLVPELKAAAGVDVGLPAGFALRADGMYVGDQVLDNDAANTQPELDAYVVVNLRASWERPLARASGARWGRLGVFVEARNALDESYATRGIYALDFSTFTNETFVTPAPGRRYLLGVTWKM